MLKVHSIGNDFRRVQVFIENRLNSLLLEISSEGAPGRKSCPHPSFIQHAIIPSTIDSPYMNN